MAGNPKSRVETVRVPPDRIRNVVLVGHATAGKTCLIEALLLGTGAISRLGRVEDGSTVCDHEEVEHRLGRSVSLAVASVLHEGVRVTFVDTPGHPDFVGEVRAGLWARAPGRSPCRCSATTRRRPASSACSPRRSSTTPAGPGSSVRPTR